MFTHQRFITDTSNFCRSITGYSNTANTQREIQARNFSGFAALLNLILQIILSFHNQFHYKVKFSKKKKKKSSEYLFQLLVGGKEDAVHLLARLLFKAQLWLTESKCSMPMHIHMFNIQACILNDVGEDRMQ